MDQVMGNQMGWELGEIDPSSEGTWQVFLDHAWKMEVPYGELLSHSCYEPINLLMRALLEGLGLEPVLFEKMDTYSFGGLWY